MPTKAELLIMKIKKDNSVIEYAPQTLAEYVTYSDGDTTTNVQSEIDQLKELINQFPSDEEITTMISTIVDPLTKDAPDEYNTFKEIADYIVLHGEVHDAMTEVINHKADKTNGIYWGTNLVTTGGWVNTTVDMEIEGITEYYEGLVIAFKHQSAYCGWININKLGNIPARYGNDTNAGFYGVGFISIFVYDGTVFKSVYSYYMDLNASYIYTYGSRKVSTALQTGNIIVNDGIGWRPLNTTIPFDISEQVCYASRTVPEGGNISAVHRMTYFTVDNLATLQSGFTFENGKFLYVKGHVDGTWFKPASNAPITMDIPTTEDGYQYLCFAKIYSTTHAELLLNQLIYEFKGGIFRQYNPYNFTLHDGVLTITI